MTDFDAARLNEETAGACRTRLSRLREALRKERLDALLVTNEKDILYLSGFVGHDSLLLVRGDGAEIISDPRYDEFLDSWKRSGIVDVVMGVRHRLHESVGALCKKHSLRRFGFQSETLSVARHGLMASAAAGGELVSTSGLVSRLRMKKDALEVSRIEQAVRWQQEGLRAALARLRPGMSEMEFAAMLEYEVRSQGAFGASFDSIIATGTNSSIIHYLPGRAPIKNGTLLVDWGARTPDGYNSDMTRTFGVGRLPPKVRDIYKIVAEAQQAAIAACRPGKVCAEIDAVARTIVTQAGHGEHFRHGLGHGLGLDVHESPFFNDLETKVVLEPGMVMTVEPGIYVPGVGGVRIEDDVLITDSGARVLCDYPKDLDSTLIEPMALAGA